MNYILDINLKSVFRVSQLFSKIMSKKTLVIGCSGTVGLDFIEVNKNKNKNILYYSRKKPNLLEKKNWYYLDFDKIEANKKKKLNEKERNKIASSVAEYFTGTKEVPSYSEMGKTAE